jgi:AbrB family looped-hinge helix DNA binding protein
MSIIKVKDKYQLTLPAELRERSGLEIGDIVEAKWERGKITLTPKSVVDRIRDVAPTPHALKAVQEDARRKGLNKLTMEEIDTEIAAYRKEQTQRKQPKTSKR